MAPQAARPSSKEFGKFVKRRQAELGRVVVDLRPSSDFQREHFVGATSIPAGELEARLLELPPPFGQPLIIVGNEEVRASWLELVLYVSYKCDTAGTTAACSKEWYEYQVLTVGTCALVRTRAGKNTSSPTLLRGPHRNENPQWTDTPRNPPVSTHHTWF